QLASFSILFCTFVATAPRSPLFPYTTLFRSGEDQPQGLGAHLEPGARGRRRRRGRRSEAERRRRGGGVDPDARTRRGSPRRRSRSEEHTPELQSLTHIVYRPPLGKKKHRSLT